MTIRVVAVLVVVWGSVAWAQRTPYLAVVSQDRAYVRSGPGQHYYPTGVLRQGAVVEVYRHDPGGWLAIRPPVGSFSWVPADAVELLNEEVGRITRGGVVARIGSTLSPVRELWQVKLRQGELVAVIAQVEDQQGRWFKIEPPSGEFRWIFHRAVRPLGRSNLPAASQSQAPPPSGAVQPASALRSEALAGQARLDGKSPLVPVAPPKPPGQSATASPAKFSQDKEAKPVIAPDEFEERLLELELELSRRVSRPRSQWQLEDLRRQAEQLVAQAEHPSRRAKARELVRRIERFVLIAQGRTALLAQQRRLQHLAQAPQQAKPLSPVSSVPSGSKSPELATSDGRGWQAAQGHYDARGQLVPVRARGFGAPQYAVVDPGSGRVVAYVSGAPGVNLRRYVGKLVGVIGVQEVVPRLDAKHVAARRIVLLEKPQETKR